MRSTAREAVFKYLFAKQFNDELPVDFLKGLLKEGVTEEDCAFAFALAKTAEEHAEEIAATIARLAQDYSYERIYAADKCALFIGIAELTYSEDVPKSVAIDEAMKLSAKYSTQNSLSFVNGILAAYYNQLQGENQ
ncbi:MAG: transcription antitermination factor NusB [Bacillota bacterium]|nr:MAG: transcription antitermination factor NusB [Bacillota bacterium]